MLGCFRSNREIAPVEDLKPQQPRWIYIALTVGVFILGIGLIGLGGGGWIAFHGVPTSTLTLIASYGSVAAISSGSVLDLAVIIWGIIWVAISCCKNQEKNTSADRIDKTDIKKFLQIK